VNYIRYFSDFDKNLLMPGYRIGFRFWNDKNWPSSAWLSIPATRGHGQPCSRWQ
jgi:hypothetical protein